MRFIKLLSLTIQCTLLISPYTAHPTPIERSLLFRPDDDRHHTSPSALNPRENLAQYKGLSPSWQRHIPVRDSTTTSHFASDAAHNVFLRCTVINFLNGPSHTYQTIPPPQLPAGFRENFEKSLYVRERIVGAKNGEETPYVRVEMSANTIHGHPITLAEYRKLLKNEQS